MDPLAARIQICVSSLLTSQSITFCVVFTSEISVVKSGLQSRRIPSVEAERQNLRVGESKSVLIVSSCICTIFSI